VRRVSGSDEREVGGLRVTSKNKRATGRLKETEHRGAIYSGHGGDGDISTRNVRQEK
jgi:hypothetical protein